MDVGEDRDPVDRFEQDLKRWAERPPRVSPEEASRRVLEATRRRRRRTLTRRALLAAAAVLALVAIPGVRRERPAPQATPTAAVPLEPRPLGAGEALIWLDADTPLYMTFEAPPVPRGGVP
jgi:hypothetical protein